ncbi:MAG: CsbD family protein [Prochlorococcaceae cyanobacterium]
MSNRNDAAAKDAEGKLEAAYGDLTGDTGHQIKGKAKQVQASAMNAAEDLKQGAKSVAEKVADAADQLAADLS